MLGSNVDRKVQSSFNVSGYYNSNNNNQAKLAVEEVKSSQMQAFDKTG